MKYEITVTVNLGNYENVKFMVSDAGSFEDADKMIKQHIDKRQLTISRGLTAYFKDVK